MGNAGHENDRGPLCRHPAKAGIHKALSDHEGRTVRRRRLDAPESYKPRAFG